MQRRHILAIDNDQAVLELFRSLLEQEGCQVSTQNYSGRNLDQVAALAPDVIILDYMWKEEDEGWSFLQMLRMNPATARIPIVLCTTAVREVAELSTHLEEMKVRVVLKPFDIETLLGVISAQLADNDGVSPPSLQTE